MNQSIEEIAASLLKGQYSSLTIGFNEEHACMYVSAQEYHDKYGEYRTGPDMRIDWVSEEERLKALETNSVWSCQWYPESPVGFCCLGASSFEALLEGLRKHLEQNQ